MWFNTTDDRATVHYLKDRRPVCAASVSAIWSSWPTSDGVPANVGLVICPKCSKLVNEDAPKPGARFIHVRMVDAAGKPAECIVTSVRIRGDNVNVRYTIIDLWNKGNRGGPWEFSLASVDRAVKEWI